MSGFADEGAAAAALAAANSDDVTPVAVEPVEQVVEAPAVDAGTNLSESFTNIDMSSLTPEQRAVIEPLQKSLQGDYTRKTQEIAPIKQLMEQSGMSLEDAQQAISFAKSLNDPVAVQQLYERLREHYGSQEETETEDETTVDPRDRQLGELSTRLERFEQAQLLTQAESQLATAQASVRTAYPDFKEADMSRVEQLAIAHMQGGKDVTTALSTAAKEFSDWRQEVLSSYVEGKGKVSANGKPLVAGAHAQTPEKFANLDDATKAALAAFGNDWAT